MTILRALALALLLLPLSSSPLLADQSDGRSLGMAITSPEHGDFPSALATAKDAGVTRVPLTFSWRSLEPEQETYDDRSVAIAALMIPAMGVDIDLTITPISGSNQVVPRDLMGKSFDDPVLITRYLEMLDHALGVLSGADVRMLLVGVEADLYLGDDPTAWKSFATFTSEVADFVHLQRPEIEVGVQSSTYSRVNNPKNWEAIDAVCDFIATSYYPLTNLQVNDPSTVADDFDALTALYPNRVIRIVEAGFPSSRVNGSSPELQAEFVHALFAAWDDHAEQIQSITIWTEHEYSPYEVDQIERASGDKRSPYAALVGSVGLRSWDDSGSAKPAWTALLEETQARGWQP